MNNADDILKKILLNMKYDASKTLKENKEIIFEDPNTNNSNLKSPGGKWTADKDYRLSALGGDWTLTKGSVFEGWDNVWIGSSRYYTDCPGPKCAAWSKALDGIRNPYNKAGDGLRFYDIIFQCIDSSIHQAGGWTWISSSLENSDLLKKLKSHFCGNPKSISIDPSNVEIEVSSDNIQIAHSDNYQFKPDTNKKETQAKTQETKGKPAPTKEEILARTDAHLVAPRIYAESLGHKDWDNYKKVFCCPTYQENKTENIKCNQNIGLAMKQGWKPGSKIPDGMKSSYCKGDDEIDYKIEGDGSDGTDGDYSDLPLSGGL
jgi:hypothetical protein